MADFEVSISCMTEGKGPTAFVAELGPVAEDGVFGAVISRGVGSGGSFESSTEISLEAVAGGRCNISQGCDCGYFCSKWERNASSVRCCRREASSAMMLASPGS